MELGVSRNLIDRPVSHKLFGPGKIIDVRRGGQELHVRFAKFTMWLPSLELQMEPIEEQLEPRKVLDVIPQPSVVAEVAPPILALQPNGPRTAGRAYQPQLPEFKSETVATELSPRSLGPLRNRRMVEALRLGLVAAEDIELFTFHRQDEVASISQGFAEVATLGGAVRIIQGDYGTGKSHFLEYIKSMALKNGFLVLPTELDAFEIQPNRPKRIYQALVQGIISPDQGEISLRQLIDEAAKDKKIYETFTQWPEGHHYLGHALKLAKHKSLEIDGITWGDWIEGDPLVMDNVHSSIGYLPSLYDFYIAGNIYCNILSGVGHLAQALGYKGMLILIDEAESLCFLQGYKKETADTFFKGMSLIALGQTRAPFREENLIRTKRRPLPFIYKPDAKVFFVLAFTPRFFTPDVIKQLPSSTLVELSVFDLASVEELCATLWETYKHAYIMPIGLHDVIVKRLPKVMYRQLGRGYMTLRQVIKTLVETFDMLRHYPNHSASSIVDELIRGLPA